MLNQDGLLKVEDIVDRKTSDIRQDVSVLKQDVSILKQDMTVLKTDMVGVKTELRHVGVLLEDQRKDTKLILEILGQHSKKLHEFSNMKMGFDNHEMRITHLEKAYKRKSA